MSLSKLLIHLPWISENTLIDLEANRSYLLYLRQNIKNKLKRVFSSHFSISFLYCVSNKHNNLFGGSLLPKEKCQTACRVFPRNEALIRSEAANSMTKKLKFIWISLSLLCMFELQEIWYPYFLLYPRKNHCKHHSKGTSTFTKKNTKSFEINQRQIWTYFNVWHGLD